MEENPEITGEKLENNGRFKKGDDPRRNLEGRPVGQKNYTTLYREALIKLAEMNGKEPEDLELELISKGIMSARAGDYSFYRDILDRLHGRPMQRTEISGELTSKVISIDE